MHVNKILPVNYNSRTNQKEQKNPNFGKLMIGSGVSTALIKEIVSNQELKSLVKLFDNVGIDLKAIMYYTVEDTSTLTSHGCHFELVDPKFYRKRNFSSRLVVDGDNEKEVLEKIKNLPAGTANKNFERYYNKYNYPKHFKNKKQEYDLELTPECIDRQKALDEVNEFNKALSSDKEARQKTKSFWEKLSDLFN